MIVHHWWHYYRDGYPAVLHGYSRWIFEHTSLSFVIALSAGHSKSNAMVDQVLLFVFPEAVDQK